MVTFSLNKTTAYILWILNIALIIFFSILGNSIQDILKNIIGTRGIGFLFASFIGGPIIIAGVIIYRKNIKRSFHLIWIVGTVVVILLYLHDNPVRWYHIPLFGFCGYLSVQLFKFRTGTSIGILIGILDEFLQYNLLERTGSVEDVIINIFSTGVGIGIWFLIQEENQETP